MDLARQMARRLLPSTSRPQMASAISWLNSLGRPVMV